MTRSALTIAAIGAGTALSAIACANDVDLKFVGLDYAGTLSGDVTFYDSATHSDVSEDVYIGKLLFTDGSSEIATVCGDLSSALDYSYHTYSESQTDPLSISNFTMAADIVAADFNKANNAQEGAALQLAVWSALYNGGNTFSANGPDFKVTGISNSVLQQAATYYEDSNTQGSALYFHIPSGFGGQSQFAPTPEPTSVGALGIGLTGLLARRRKARV